MEYLGVAIIGVAGFFIGLKFFFKRITVFEFQRGIQYCKGRFVKILGPGSHWLCRFNSTVTTVDIRTIYTSIPGQEVLTSDGVTVKISLAAEYEIADPNTAINKVQSYYEALYTILQLALRKMVSSRTADELLESRSSFREKLQEATVKQVEEIGLKLTSVDVKDIMFPGDLKKVFSQVVKAKKDGLAALERARGETAALRNLANSAQLLENNPALLQLRMLQTVGESSGNTVVLNTGNSSNLIPLGKKSDQRADRTDKSEAKPEQD